MDILIFILTAAGVLVAVILISRHFDARRREGMREAALRVGYRYAEKTESPYTPGLEGFALFSSGRSRKTANVMQGTAETADLAVFDYRYVTGGGKNSHTYSQTVAHFRDRQLALPEFTLRPEGLLAKIGAAFGYQDIDFSSQPEFSAKYLLRGPNEEAIRRVFDLSVLFHFDHNPGWSVEGRSGQLVVYRHGKKVAPERIPEFIEQTTAIYRLFRESSMKF